MAIVGIVTIFSCDGVDCNVWKAVDADNGIDEFIERWYVGVHLHFCPACRIKLVNQAAIVEDERELTEHVTRLAGKVRSTIAKRQTEAAHVH